MQTTLAKNGIHELIKEEIKLIKLPAFIKHEVNLIFDRLNDYKISNIYKNIDLFLRHLNTLSQIYNKELEKNYLIEQGSGYIKNLNETFNLNFKNLSKEKISHINFFMPKLYIRRFGNLYFNKDIELNLEEYLDDKISKMMKTRFKILTMLNLSILEYANSPSRIILFQKIMKN